MTQEVVFNPESWSKAGSIVDDAGAKIKAEIDKLFDQVTDYQVLGENDMIGKIVNFLYRTFIEVVREIVKGLVDGVLDQSETMKQVGKVYQDTSEAAQSLAALVGKDFDR